MLVIYYRRFQVLPVITKNRYAHPVAPADIVRISTRESPAHRGRLRFSVDFIVPQGTRVLAAADGRVVDVKADSKKGGDDKKFEKDGNFIEIYHRNFEYSEYEHLSKVVVKPGEQVSTGQLIGYSGATGWLGGLGPHLHFMVGVYEDYHTLRIRWLRRH